MLSLDAKELGYVGRKSPLATKNLLEVVLCFLLTCSSCDDVIAF